MRFTTPLNSEIEKVEETVFESDFSQKFQNNIKKYCPYREATRILFPPEKSCRLE